MFLSPSLRRFLLPAAASFSALCLAAFAEQPQRGTAHRLLVANTGKVAVVSPDGTIERELKTGGLHDVSLLPNGNILFQLGWTKVAEADPTGKIVWEYNCQSNGNENTPLEVHGFERLSNGLTMIAESGPGRIIEVDKDGKIHHQIKLTVDRPSKHRDTRLVRSTPAGTYLVAHEGDGKIREYNREGKVVWEFHVPLFDQKPRGGHGPEAFGNQAFSAVRLANGNTLIGTGNGHSVLEVNPKGEIVWKVEQNDLPGITLAWVTRVERLANGNTRFGNCHAGKENPLSIEVDPSKKVVWSYYDFQRFGNATVAVDVVDGIGDSSKK
jgi:hypothetical protein